MKIIFSKEFKRKASIISIFFAEIFQFYIIITISDILMYGATSENIVLLIFNVFYILSLNFYNSKINKIFELRGKYLSLKNKNINNEEFKKETFNICQELFEDILDGDFRP